jgi:hypothetical protein
MDWRLSLTLRPTVSHPVCLGIKHTSGAYDKIFITVIQLRVCRYGALSLTTGRVCRLQMLLVLASAAILESKSRGIRDHILVSQIRDFPFRRLLRLAGTVEVFYPASTRDNKLSFITSRESNRGHHSGQFVCWSPVSVVAEKSGEPKSLFPWKPSL